MSESSLPSTVYSEADFATLIEQIEEDLRNLTIPVERPSPVDPGGLRPSTVAAGALTLASALAVAAQISPLY